MLPGNIWRSETWFRATPGARDRYNERVLRAQHEQAIQPEYSLQKHQEEIQSQRADWQGRLQSWRSLRQVDTSTPGRSALQPSNDYRIREGPYWKRVHIKPRTALYKPEQTEDEPDITTLTSYPSTMARPTTGERFNRLDDEWTGEHKGLRAPQQPTSQERAEHELTHLPYRSRCTICIQSKGRQDHRKAQQSRHPVIQCDLRIHQRLTGQDSGTNLHSH